MLPFQLEWTFFGLQPKDRIRIHESIFDLIYFGKGGFNWADVYNLPVFIRNFYISRIEKVLKDQRDAEKKAVRKAQMRTPKKK